MKHHDKIEINPDIMCGKPVIKGTRITVELILRNLSEGLAPAERFWCHARFLTKKNQHVDKNIVRHPINP
jgi:hypothetical protein